MKHAGPQAIAALAPVVKKLRKLHGLREPKPGTFYRGSSAFLHFHEDAAGFFADLKVDGEFIRLPVNSDAQIAAMLDQAASVLKK